MTLATGIEIGSGGSPSPGLAGAQGTAPGMVRFRAGAQSLLPSTGAASIRVTADGAQSFRAGWQSLLTSLGTTLEGLSANEAGAIQGDAATGTMTGKAAAILSGSNSTLAAVMDRPAEVGREKGSGETGAGAGTALAGTRGEEIPVCQAAGVIKPAPTKAGEKKPALGIDEAHMPRTARTIKAVKTEAAAAEPTISLPSASNLQAVPAAVIATPIVPNPVGTVQPAQADIHHAEGSVAGRTPQATPSSTTELPDSDNTAEGIGTLVPVARGVTGGQETSARSRQGALVQRASESSAMTHSAVDASRAERDVVAPAAATYNESKEPIERPATREDLAEWVASTQEPAETVDAKLGRIEAATPASKPDQSTASAQEPVLANPSKQEAGTAFVSTRSPIEAPSSGQISSQTFAATPKRDQGAAFVFNPIEAVAHGFDSSQSTLKNLESHTTVFNRIEAPASSQGASQSQDGSQRIDPDQTTKQEITAPKLDTIQSRVARQDGPENFAAEAEAAGGAGLGSEQIHSVAPGQESSRRFATEPDRSQTTRSETKTSQASSVQSAGIEQDSILSFDLDRAMVQEAAPDSTPIQAVVSRQDSFLTDDSSAKGPEIGLLNPKPIQSMEDSREPAQAADAGHEAIQRLTSSPDTIVPAMQDLGPIAPEPPSKEIPRTFVSVLSGTEDEAQTLNQVQGDVPALAASQRVAPSQDRGLITESSWTLVEPDSASVQPIQTILPEQSLVQAAASSPTLTEKPVENRNPSPRIASMQSTLETTLPSWRQPRTLAPSGDYSVAVEVVAVPLAKLALERPLPEIGSSGSEPPPVTIGAVAAIATSYLPPVNEALPAPVSKSISNGSGKTSALPNARPVRSAGRLEAAQRVEVQPSGPLADIGAVAPGSRDAASLPSEFAGGSNAVAGGPDPRETFATLDAQGVMGKPAWIHAGMQRAEAGFQDPTLGWVGVRAESGGGRVHAELVPGSADAAQALSGHLAGLNAFLAEHHTPVETLTLTAPQSESGGQGGDRETGQNMQQGAGQQTDQPMPQSAEGGLPAHSSRDVEEFAQSARDMSGSTRGLMSGGKHISVMA